MSSKRDHVTHLPTDFELNCERFISTSSCSAAINPNFGLSFVELDSDFGTWNRPLPDDDTQALVGVHSIW
jgi:hypothetical protein